jgi:hypothetical protein
MEYVQYLMKRWYAVDRNCPLFITEARGHTKWLYTGHFKICSMNKRLSKLKRNISIMKADKCPLEQPIKSPQGLAFTKSHSQHTTSLESSKPLSSVSFNQIPI